MSIRWNHVSIYPEEMLEPKKIVDKTFPLGSVAGCVGIRHHKKKPGINEDGGRIVYSEDQNHIMCILADGHKERDGTEILLDTFKELVDSSRWSGLDVDFIPFCHRFNILALKNLKTSNAKGWASYTMVGIDRLANTIRYFSVGDVMVFAHDPDREWGPYYQIGSRHYYEWINQNELIGYHTGRIKFHDKQRIIITTDGVIDEPVINMDSIKAIFDIENIKNEAYAIVDYSLKNNPEHDDNITTIFLRMK